MDAGRSRLVRLSDDEVRQLLVAFSTLSIMWAKPARVSQQALDTGQPRTLRAVRAGLAQRVDAFMPGLAWAATVALAGENDLDLHPHGPESEEAAELLAEGAGAQLGADLGTFVVNVVAESELPLADRVRERLDHLVAVAKSAGLSDASPHAYEEGQVNEAAKSDMLFEPGDAPEPSVDGGLTEDRAGWDENAAPAGNIDRLDDQALLEEVLHLLEIAPAIADGLRSIASSIQACHTPMPEASAILAGATDWVARAEHAAGDRDDLNVVATEARASIEARTAARVELQGLLEAIETLEGQGHEKYALGLLQQHNFSDTQQLRDALAVASDGSQPGQRDVLADASAAVEAPVAPSAAGSAVAAAAGLIDEVRDPLPDDQAPVQDTPHLAETLQQNATVEHDSTPERDDTPPHDDEEPVPGGGAGDETQHDTPRNNDATESSPSLIAPFTRESDELDNASQTRPSGPPDCSPGNHEATESLARDSVRADGDTGVSTISQRGDDPEGTRPTAHGDAWTDGTIAGLVSKGRDPLAVLAAHALDVSPHRTRMLRLFAGAFGLRSDVLLSQDPGLIVEDSGADRTTDENRLLLASHSRLALELGFSPVGSLERFRQGAALDGQPAGDVVAEIVRLVSRGFKRPASAGYVSTLPEDWQSYAEKADQALESLQSIRISYQRASRIIHYLARANQSIGGVITLCARLARQSALGDRPDTADWAEVEDSATKLRDPHYVERLLSSTDRVLSTPQQLRNAIVASARDRLHTAIEEVADLLEEGLSLRARFGGSGVNNDPQEMAGLVALAGRSDRPADGSVGSAALQRLLEWLQADAPAIAPAVTLNQLLLDEMLPLFEIEHDASGAPLRSRPTSSEIELLIEGRDPLLVFRGYLNAGNLRAAQTALAQSGVGRTPSIDDAIAEATQEHMKRQRELVAEVDRVLDRLRSIFDADLVRQLSQELEEHREVTPGRFDLHIHPLQDIRNRGEEQLSEVRTGLRERAEALPDEGASRRILQLLDSRDEQLAVDYLTLAESGESLPALAPPAGDDFGDFFPQVVLSAATAGRQREIDNITEVRKFLGSTANPTNRMLAQGLKAWNELVLDRYARQMTEGRLANVLRLLGLIPADQKWIRELTKARHAGYATYAVKAFPIDRSYVPSFGTQAHGQYDVTIVWDQASPQRLLQYIEASRRTQANVILYLGTLGVEHRLELRKLTNRQGFAFSPIVVDMPVVAWLSTRDEPAWRLTQRVTLPFTTLNPYTPFAGGEVPDEVFVGREDERREITDPTGSMFVYGGRQLGKSALLRRVEREIMRVRESSNETFEHGGVAVYLDLKSEGIGESAAPSALWAAIAPRLVKAGVLPTRSTSWTADSVTSGILDWLESDTSRRLLLLLDEADNFLTLDARDTGPTQVGGFPVLQRLKGVMERTGRRFKPVFAGLHQVQRFHDLPNTPVVHGGQDILIGPLKPVDARELVRDPLYALGYEFETSDTMWRLLRLTNYQASLIQIVCEALVRHMKSKPLPAQGGRIVISARDVDDVYAKREVRDLIAQRFRWTINLDNRYRVIALVTALRSLDSRPGERFRAADLHDECEYYWAAGFARSVLSSGEFFRYLDEMQGLGVLQRQGDEFGLRSPSILGLLGSRETIETELLEASDQLDVGYQYNPTMNRRVLTQEATGEETRSPLPDSELASLLSHDKSEPRIKVVAGTMALGLDRVRSALHRAAAERPVRLVDVEPLTLSDQIVGADGTHLLLDLCKEDEVSRRSALGALATTSETFVTVILPADDVPLDADRFDWPVVQLRRWSLEGLQSWHDSPFPRQALRDTTGGWPRLVERAISFVMLGASTESALESITAELAQNANARVFLDGAGVPVDISKSWLEWFGSDEDGDTMSLTPASLDDLNAAFGADSGEIIERLQLLDVVDESPGGWLLDRVVAIATRSLHE